MREMQKKTITVNTRKVTPNAVADHSGRSGDITPPRPCSSLLEMKPGERGIIQRIEAGMPEVRRRLLEMGLVCGTAIECVRFAPLGDPLQVRVDRTDVSMRKAEARLVFVRRTE